MGPHQLSDSYLSMSDQTTCNGDYNIYCASLSDTPPDGYRFVYIDELLNNYDFRNSFQDYLGYYDLCSVINGVVTGKAFNIVT